MPSDVSLLEEPQVALLPIGEEIDAVWAMRERLKKRREELEEDERLLEEKKQQLLERLEKEGIDGARGKKATVSQKELIVPQVVDWDEYYRYIHRNKAYHLLERRPAAKAYRELMDQRGGKAVPGVVSFKKRSLDLRTI